MENELLYSLLKWGEFGQRRFRATLSAGEKRRIPLTVPRGRFWLVFKYRFGNIQADTINFRFNNIRNYFEENILIGTELLNWPIEPKPFLSISGNGQIVVENTDVVAREFSIVLDFVVMDNEIAGKIRELVLGKREEFREEVTKQAGTGGA